MEMTFSSSNFRWPPTIQSSLPLPLPLPVPVPESKIKILEASEQQAVAVTGARFLSPLPGSFARHSSFSLASPAAAPFPRRSSTTTTTTATTDATTITTSPSSTSSTSSTTTSSGGSVDSRDGVGRSLPLIITSWKTSPVTPPIEHKDNAPWGFASKQKTVDPYAAVPDPPTPKSPSSPSPSSPSSPSSPCMDDSTRHADSDSSPRTDHETSESESVQCEPLAAAFASLKIETPICSAVEKQSPLLSGISVAVSQLNVQSRKHPTLHILSQTLPCPAPTDKPSSNPPAAFPLVVSQIGSAAKAGGQCPYVTITHAMPPKSTLSSLPTSPPTTPDLATASDYFNFRVFSSATPAPGYDTVNRTTSSPKNPIVPPESVHAAVIERYIPPSSEQEYYNIFSAGMKSVLVDRFQELSSDGGTLTLIYPTKKGVNTFKRDHLGPILDPVIRRLIVTKHISSDIAAHLQSMPSVRHMGDYEEMEAKIHEICNEINENSRADASSPTSQSILGGDQLSVVYSATETIHVSRNVWVDWYLYQGASRAKATLVNYLNIRNRSAAHKKPSAHVRAQQAKVDINSNMIFHEIYEGLRAEADAEPDSGIELAMFIIQRSRPREEPSTTEVLPTIPTTPRESSSQQQ